MYTKISAMKGKLLKYADYADLVRSKRAYISGDYFEDIKKISRFFPKDKKVLECYGQKDFLGLIKQSAPLKIIAKAEIEAYNAGAIYRLKNFYEYKTEEIYPHLIPYKIDLQKTIDNPFEHRKKAYLKAKKLYPKSIATSLHYLFLKEIEIKNLIKVTQGIKQGINGEEIIKNLVII